MQELSDVITEKEIILVQSTWAQVVPKSFEVAETFYDNLFKMCPHFIPMFKSDMKSQGKKLMQMIGTVVLGLSNMSNVEEILVESGRRHVEYGVRMEDYEVLKDVLMETFSRVFGAAFTPEVQVAWEKTYDIMADIMKSASTKQDSVIMRILRKSKFW